LVPAASRGVPTTVPAAVPATVRAPSAPTSSAPAKGRSVRACTRTEDRAEI
ncbi:unnamed protein product, partial [Effrenium voratum]